MQITPPGNVLVFWFTFAHGVNRKDYLRHGIVLVMLKYGVDAALVWFGTATLWTPLNYLTPAPVLLADQLADAPPMLVPVLTLWTLPFLWIGVSMTMRRLMDAGRSGWWALLFFVPLVSYLLMAFLAVAPSPIRPATIITRPETTDRLRTRLLSITLGSVLGLAMLWLSVRALDSYGLALFMGTPFAMGLVTGFSLSRGYPASVRDVLGVVTVCVMIVAATGFFLGFEGAVCLLMVAPLGLAVALMGGLAGRFLAYADERLAPGATLIVILLPGAIVLEDQPGTANLREVRSAVVIDAAPMQVWEAVIAFPPIPEPDGLLFRLGLAYPIRAEIRGSGLGAVRYCVFSTGAFVEPITVWEPGVRLGFDVEESPPPLREWSLYDIAPPHLDGYLAPKRGEFRLVELGDGRTRLEGSTWYEQRLRPEGYWVVFSDLIIRKIHDRVLGHIAIQVSPGHEPVPDGV